MKPKTFFKNPIQLVPRVMVETEAMVVLNKLNACTGAALQSGWFDDYTRSEVIALPLAFRAFISLVFSFFFLNLKSDDVDTSNLYSFYKTVCRNVL